jgi:threonine dehydratase
MQGAAQRSAVSPACKIQPCFRRANVIIDAYMVIIGGAMPERIADFAGIARAAERLAGRAIVTPLVENAELNAAVGGRVLVKAETLQHCGSFKFRGAYNLVSRLAPDERARGVLAWSSGNHAQGVARAAKLFGCPAVIVMPADAPRVKAERVKADGAEIVVYDRYTDDRERIGRALAAERGLALAPSYDHVDIIEGQGTLGLEAAEQARAQDARLDAFICCCGGGGMTAGVALALEERSPGTSVHIAEPEGYDDAWASIRDGVRRRADTSRPTICDAIATPTPGEITFPILKRLVRGGVSLSEREVGDAVAFAYRYLKLVVEPGGAVALAAVLSGKFDAKGKTVGVTLSGGNVDPGLFSRLVGGHS